MFYDTVLWHTHTHTFSFKIWSFRKWPCAFQHVCVCVYLWLEFKYQCHKNIWNIYNSLIHIYTHTHTHTHKHTSFYPTAANFAYPQQTTCRTCWTKLFGALYFVQEFSKISRTKNLIRRHKRPLTVKTVNWMKTDPC